MGENTDQIEELRYIYALKICNLFYFKYCIGEIYNIGLRKVGVKYLLHNVLSK